MPGSFSFTALPEKQPDSTTSPPVKFSALPARQKSPAFTPLPPKQNQAKTPSVPTVENKDSWLDGPIHAVQHALEPVGKMLHMSQQTDLGTQGLRAITGHSENDGTAKQAGSALGTIGNALTSSLSLAGALGSDIADPKSNDAHRFYDAAHDIEGGLGDLAHLRGTDKFNRVNEKYFPTSDANLRDLDSMHVPGVSQTAHFIREHPILANFPLTTALTFLAPGAEGHAPGLLGKALKGVGGATARGVDRGAQAFAQSSHAQTPIGRAAVQGGQAIKKAGQSVNEGYQNAFGNPARKIVRSVKDDPTNAAAATNRAMAMQHAPQRANHDAVTRTHDVFRQTTPVEKQQAIDLYEAEGHEAEFAKAPPHIQDAARKLNANFATTLAKEGPNALGPMRSVPANVHALDPTFATEEWRNRELNVMGIPQADRGAVLKAAQDLHLTQYKPNLAYSSPESIARVQRSAQKLKAVYDEIDAAQESTHPDLLNSSTKQSVYFPKRDLFEDTSGKDKTMPAGPKGGRTISNAAKGHSNYGSVAQIRAAGYPVFTGLKPEEALFRDLKAKWGNVHATKAYYALASLPDRNGGLLMSKQDYVDPQTGATIDHAEARNYAQQDREMEAKHAHARDQGIQLGPDGKPVLQPKRIPNPDSLKATALYAQKQQKVANRLATDVDAQGRRFQDVAAKGAVATEGHAENLVDKTAANVEGQQRALEQGTAEQRKAFDAAREKTADAQDKSINRIGELQDKHEQGQAEDANKRLDTLLTADQRARAAATKLNPVKRSYEPETEAQPHSLKDEWEAENQHVLGGKGERVVRAYDKPIKDAQADVRNSSDTTTFEEVAKTHEDLNSAFDRVAAATEKNIERADAKRSDAVASRGDRMKTAATTLADRIKKINAATIGDTAKERARLRHIAIRNADRADANFNNLATKYYIAAHDKHRAEMFERGWKKVMGDLNNPDAESQVQDRVERDYMVHDPHYVNAMELKKAGINVPGLTHDLKVPKDMLQYFTENAVPPKQAQPMKEFFDSLNAFSKATFVYNPVIHGIWNLGGTYIGRTRDIPGLVRAMPMLLGTMVGHEKMFANWERKPETQQTLQYLQMENGWNPGGFSDKLDYFKDKQEVRDPGGRITGYTQPKGTSAITRMTSNTKDLPYAQRILKYTDAAQRWNSRVVFDRFEKWYAVNIFNHELKRLGSLPLAARSVRDAMGTDLLTPFEKKNISPYFWFYPWFKTINKFAIATGVSDPAWWNAPLQGAQSERDGEGAREAQAGPYSLLRRKGNDEYQRLDFPFPQRALNAVATAAIGDGDPRSQTMDRIRPAVNEVLDHANPFSQMGAKGAIQALVGKDTPGYLQVADPNAGPAESFEDAGKAALSGFSYPLEQAEGFANVARTQGLPAALAQGALSAAGIRSSVQLKGLNHGGIQRDSAASNFYRRRRQISNALDKNRPGKPEAVPELYAKALRDQEQLYRERPEMQR